MNIRIALLFTGILIATSSGVARAALQPVDPAHAPVAAVDRFNTSAALDRHTSSRSERADRLRHSSLEHARLFAHG